MEATISVTSNCNLHCKMCDIPLSAPQKQEMELPTFKRLVDEIDKLGFTDINLTGGEPLLRKDIFDIIYYIRRKDIRVNISTNGTLVTKSIARRLASSGLNWAAVSIEGPEYIHDKIRGKGNFKKAIRGIKLLKKQNIGVSMATVILKENYLYLSDVIKLAHNLGIRTVLFQPFTKDNISDKSRTKTLTLDCQDVSRLKKEFINLMRLSKKYNIKLNSMSYLKNILNFFLEKKTNSKSCLAPFLSCTIDTTGNVHPCWSISPVGNIKNESLTYLWNSKYSDARQMAKDGKCPSCMQNCYENLYNYKENLQSKQLLVTNACNNNCKVCKFLNKRPEMNLSIEEIKEQMFYRYHFIDKKELIISGGEPALRRDIFDIIEYAKKIGFKKIILETNGRIFSYKDFCQRMIRIGIDQFNIYFYSHKPEVHNKITRVKGSWEQTVEGIKNLTDMKQNVQVNIVVCKETYKDVFDTVGFLKELKVFNLHLVFIEQAEVDKLAPQIIEVLKYAIKNRIKISFNKYVLPMNEILNQLFPTPKTVQFGLANACNNSCVYCVNHSPYLDEKTRKSLSKWKEAILDFSLFKKYVDELNEMGVKKLELSGGGEPFVHPKIMEMIVYAKKKNMNLRILSNLNLVNKNSLKKIFDYRVNEICVNFSAATAQTYVRVHPNQSEQSFHKLIDDVSFLTNLRKNIDDVPQIRIIFVICKLNCHEIYEIAKLAKRIEANFIEFKIIETTPLTRKLQLTKEQFDQLEQIVEKVERYLDDNGIQSNIDYLKKLSRIDEPKDEFTENLYKKIGCFIAWHYCYITPRHWVAPCTLHPGLVKINGKSFSEIWNSKEYNLFRKRAMDKKWRQNHLLANRGCIRCPFYMIHLDIYNELREICCNFK